MAANVDPALAGHLVELAVFAHEIGAEGIWLVRGAANVALSCQWPAGPEALAEFGAQVNRLQWPVHLKEISRLEIESGGVIMVIRFPASDGDEAWLERRQVGSKEDNRET